MRNSTILTLLAASALSASAVVPAANLKVPTMGADFHKTMKINTSKVNANDRKALRHDTGKVKVMNLAGPSADDKVIEDPAGDAQIYVKSGMGFGYNWLYGLYTQPLDGSVSKVVENNGKIYMSNPFGTYPVPGWLEGDVKDGVITMTFPQLVNVETYDYGDGDIEEYKDYCLVFEYQEDEDGGWYYPTEAQTYQLKINEDGSYTPVDENIYLGYGAWFEDEGEETPEGGEWSWQGSLDLLETMAPNSGKLNEVPEGLTFENWNFIYDKSGSQVPVAIDGDKIYIKGLFSDPDCVDSVIVGTIADGKASFAQNQYLGISWANMKTAYFLSGKMVEAYDPDYDETYMDFERTDALVFDYDAEKGQLTASDAYVISTSPDVILYFELVEKPYFGKNDPNAKVTSLFPPVVIAYYEENPDYGYTNELMFNIPNVDPDNNMLDTSKLYYTIYVDGAPFEFFSDEYEGVEDGTTELPYDFSNGIDIYAQGGIHDLLLYPSGIERVDVQTIYRDGDNVIYSDLAPAYNASKAVSVADRAVVSSKYFDLSGREIRNPENGIYIRISKMADGSKKADKVVVRK